MRYSILLIGLICLAGCTGDGTYRLTHGGRSMVDDVMAEGQARRARGEQIDMDELKAESVYYRTLSDADRMFSTYPYRYRFYCPD